MPHSRIMRFLLSLDQNIAMLVFILIQHLKLHYISGLETTRSSLSTSLIFYLSMNSMEEDLDTFQTSRLATN